MTHQNILTLGWQNPAAFSYPTQPPQPQPAYRPNMVTPGFPLVPNPFRMPPLPGTVDPSRIDGASLSYGFAPNVVPCNIPNEQRQNGFSGPNIGWSIGDRTDGSCVSSHAEDTVQKQEVETVCRAIIVPDEDMPVYSFGQASVSIFWAISFRRISIE